VKKMATKSNQDFLAPPVVSVTTAADALTQVALAKSRAAKLDPNRDTSKVNTDRVGTSWQDGDLGGIHTPNQ
jgi:hypothetical protein